MSDVAASEPDSAEAENEVIAWYRSYAQPWYEGNPDADTSAGYYAVPTYFSLPDGVIPVPDAEAQRSFFDAFIADLRSKGWVRTTLVDIEVKMINPCTAFVETEVANETADGSPVEGDGTTGYSYLAGKTSEGWKFLSAHIT